MKRLTTTLATALIAGAFGSVAFAQNTTPSTSPNAGKTQQAPKKGDVQGQEPSSDNMDSNAQRQHSRSTPSASPSAKTNSGNNQAQTAQAGEVRNWEKIDKNKDHLISPEEMEADLQSGKGAKQQ